jgi:hypothetical protein
MSRRPGKDSAQWLQDSSAELASLDAIQKWKLHLPEPHDNAHPAPPPPMSITRSMLHLNKV